MRPNPGHLPDECIIFDDDGNVAGWRAVHVRLRNGYDTRKAGAAPWPAYGSRPPTRWKPDGKPHPFDIEFWELS